MNISYKYAGWVPTVTGNLSFTVVGTTSHPEPSDSVNIEADSKRYILTAQRRYQGDVVLPGVTNTQLRNRVGKLFGLVGRFKFILHAKVATTQGNPNSYLEGHVVIALESPAFRENVKPLFDRVREMMAEHARAPCAKRLPCVLGAHASLGPMLNNSHVVVPFQLYRNGFCYLGPPHVGRYGLDGLGPHGIEPETQRDVVAQAFYFIKDLAHRHVHHHNTTDTLCDLYEIDGYEDWRALTLYGMYRKIIRLKRQNPATTYDSADGLLAYAQAFRKLWETDVNIDRHSPTPNGAIPSYFMTEIRQSFCASNRMQEKHLDERHKAGITTTNLLVVLLIILSTTVSITGLSQLNAQGNVSVHPHLVAFRQLVLEEPYSLLGPSVALLLLARMRRISWNPITRSSGMRDIIRLLYHRMSSKMLALIVGGFGTALTAFGVGLLLWALGFSVIP